MNRDWEFEPHDPQTEPELTTYEKTMGAVAFAAYVIALAIAGAIDRGFQ